MKIDIHVGKRVAFKSNNNGWLTGEIYNEKAGLSFEGLYIPIKPIGKEYEDQLYWVEVNDIYLEAEPVEDWMRQYGCLMTKEEYMTVISYLKVAVDGLRIIQIQKNILKLYHIFTL